MDRWTDGRTDGNLEDNDYNNDEMNENQCETKTDRRMAGEREMEKFTMKGYHEPFKKRILAALYYITYLRN